MRSARNFPGVERLISSKWLDFVNLEAVGRFVKPVIPDPEILRRARPAPKTRTGDDDCSFFVSFLVNGKLGPS